MPKKLLTEVGLEPVALGLSGGADSVALLWRCHDCGLAVTALHYNHAFADENGEEAEAFVRALCQRLAVPLIVGRCPADWAASHETKEVFARRHRLAFFAEQMKALGLKRLLLAHQADDRAETALLRLARGCGGRGLTSFSRQAPFPGDPTLEIWRPLLDTRHQTLVAELQARGERWVEDCSNADCSIPRNAIRRCLAPTLPHLTMGVNRALDLLAEEEAFLAQLARAATLQADEAHLCVRPGCERVLLRRILRSWLGERPGQATCERLLSLPVGTITTIEGATRIRRREAWAWERLAPAAPPPAAPPLRIEAPGTYRFGKWKIIASATPDAGLCLPVPLIVRGRQPGDRLRPRGFTGSRKVQDIMTDLHIPPGDRDGWPLFFAASGELLWVPGMRPADLPPGPQVALRVIPAP